MAKKKDKQSEAKGGKKGGQDKKAEKAPKALDDRVPRMLRHYREHVRPTLKEQFGFENEHRIPKIEKIVVNVGIGEAPKNQKLLDSVVEELSIITGQKPVINRSRVSISNFSLREGMPVGVSTTLRRKMMYEFLDRLITAAVPRVRDFRGLPTRSFDGRGNYTIGVKEQIIFPEIEYDRVHEVHGMDITIVTSTNEDAEAYALLRQMGFPFRGDDKPVQVGMPAA